MGRCSLKRFVRLCILFGILCTGFADYSYSHAANITATDWLSPFSGQPSWDPYGPEASYTPGIPSWDPYGPGGDFSPSLVGANPFNEGLIIPDAVLYQNQIYLQAGGQLVTSGSVSLGDTFTIWMYVANWGSFVLYDNGAAVLWQSMMTPGWYKISQYAETLSSHRYQFNVSGSSNPLNVNVNPGGYPTIYSLTGRVVDPYGNGIPSAAVIISSNEGGTFTTKTNLLGYYGMDLPSGNYVITADLVGYHFSQVTGRIWLGTVSVAGKVVGYPLTGEIQYLEYPIGFGRLEGRITDQSSVGLAGAIVEVGGQVTLTDNRGNYQLDIGSGWYEVNVEKKGYLFRLATVQVSPYETSYLDITGRKVLILGSG